MNSPRKAGYFASNENLTPNSITFAKDGSEEGRNPKIEGSAVEDELASIRTLKASSKVHLLEPSKKDIPASKRQSIPSIKMLT
jgi:hypothetical protein